MKKLYVSKKVRRVCGIVCGTTVVLTGVSHAAVDLTATTTAVTADAQTGIVAGLGIFAIGIGLSVAKKIFKIAVR